MPVSKGQRRRAVNDLVRVVTESHVWRELAWSNIRSSYRLSSLGTMWITTTTAFFVIAIGLMYGQFFGQDMHTYLPYFATSFTIWGFIAGSITAGSQSLINNHNYIKGSQMPIVFHTVRVVQVQFLTFCHNAVVLIGLWLYFRWPVGLSCVLSIVGIMLTFIFIAAICLFLAIVCVRFRDVPPLIQALIQFVFFATPIIWHPEQLKFGKAVLWANPVAYFMMVARDPFLGRPLSWKVWVVAFALTLMAVSLASAAYVRYRSRIAYWV